MAASLDGRLQGRSHTSEEAPGGRMPATCIVIETQGDRLTVGCMPCGGQIRLNEFVSCGIEAAELNVRAETNIEEGLRCQYNRGVHRWHARRKPRGCTPDGASKTRLHDTELNCAELNRACRLVRLALVRRHVWQRPRQMVSHQPML